MNTKQVIVVRKDLNMRKGKMGAQIAHASLGVFSRRFNIIEDGYSKKATLELTNEMVAWLDNSYTKIVVGCDSEQDLLALQEMASNSGIVNCLVKDNGQTEFKETCSDCKGTGMHRYAGILRTQDECPTCKGTGRMNKPTYTCIALGPDTCERLDPLTKRFPLL